MTISHKKIGLALGFFLFFFFHNHAQNKIFEVSQESNQTKTDPNILENKAILYQPYVAIQYGGESKLTLFLPKFGIVRKHDNPSFKPYYGVEAGFYPMFVTVSYSVSALAGIQKGWFFVEASYSFWQAFGARAEKEDPLPKYSQHLINAKLGVGPGKFKAKFGFSFLIDEHIYPEDKRPPLVDIGQVGTIYLGVELLYNFDL